MTDPTPGQPDHQPEPGFPLHQGFPTPPQGYPQPGYPQAGYPQPSHPQPGSPQSEPVFQPGHAQPGYPPPQVDQPTFGGQPGYPGPGYMGQAQPAYPGEPGYPGESGYPGQPTYPGQPGAYQPYPQPVIPPWPGAAVEPPKRSLTWLWVGLAVLLVLGATGTVAAIAFVGAARTSSTGSTSLPTGTAATTPAAQPTTPEPEPTTPAPVQTLALPKTLAGLTQTNPAELKSLVDNLVVQLKDTMPGATAVGAGFYRDSKAAQKLVMVMQVKGSFPAPSLQVEAMFGGLGTSGVKVTDLRDVDFGSLGIGRCGKATLSSVPVTVCGWGDDDGLGLVFFYYRSISESTPLFKKIRTQLG